jgi:hypothetical protein
MRAIMVMFDSLNLHMLPPYGCNWVKAPNFQRLAEKTVTFRNIEQYMIKLMKKLMEENDCPKEQYLRLGL